MLITRYKITFVSLAAILTCLGCNNTETSPQSVPSTTEQLDTLPDIHQDILTFVKMGRAAVAGNDGTQLMTCAKGLNALGATPLNDTDDLAKNWAVAAQSMPGGDKTKSIPYRGRVKGPAYRTQTLKPGETEKIEDVYYAAEAVEMSLSALNPSPLQWEIAEYDTKEDPVCNGKANSEAQLCRFTPLWTTKYQIRISNISDQDVTYLFITN